MNILSKELLLCSDNLPRQYEAFYVNEDTVTKLGVITDLSKTFAAQDEIVGSDVFVFEGDLYKEGTLVYQSGNITALSEGNALFNGSYFIDDKELYIARGARGETPTITKINSEKKWLKVCGYYNSSSNRVGFAEASDGVYMVDASSVTKISDLTGWTQISGFGNTTSANYWGYGIKDGKLYYLYANGNGVVQIGNNTNWTWVTGSKAASYWCGFGICEGAIKALYSTSVQTITPNLFIKISGSGYGQGMFALKSNGTLWKVQGSSSSVTISNIGSSTNWKNCSGLATNANDPFKGLAYDNTALYGITYNGTTTKLADGKWIYCGGTYSCGDTAYNSHAYAIAIRKV